jgi:nascent polypeptide-associated complex subunit alpha
MFPNLDPKKMQAVMKQMGILQEEIDANRVVIEKSDGSRLIVENPSVTRIKMQGSESFQVSGEVSETEADNTEADIATIVDKTGCSEEEARKALEETEDLAEAILKLSSD